MEKLEQGWEQMQWFGKEMIVAVNTGEKKEIQEMCSKGIGWVLARSRVTNKADS